MRKRGRDLNAPVSHVFWNKGKRQSFSCCWLRVTTARTNERTNLGLILGIGIGIGVSNGNGESENRGGASASERRASGRAEVTARCENSFESSPRLIAEEGRSSTTSLCSSPLFPSCSCYHVRNTYRSHPVPSNRNALFPHFPLPSFCLFLRNKLVTSP